MMELSSIFYFVRQYYIQKKKKYIVTKAVTLQHGHVRWKITPLCDSRRHQNIGHWQKPFWLICRGVEWMQLQFVCVCHQQHRSFNELSFDSLSMSMHTPYPPILLPLLCLSWAMNINIDSVYYHIIYHMIYIYTLCARDGLSILSHFRFAMAIWRGRSVEKQ